LSRVVTQGVVVLLIDISALGGEVRLELLETASKDTLFISIGFIFFFQIGSDRAFGYLLVVF
tara:strand:- start:31 stop:216 length:186 start_codon:yes stop_codon:yes gene_type:complete